MNNIEKYIEKQNDFYDNFRYVAAENISSFAASMIGSFAVGASMKYIRDDNLMDPLAFGIGSTIFIDIFERFIQKKEPGEVLRNDFGTFVGQYLGWTLASLL